MRLPKLRTVLLATALTSTPALAQTNQIYNPGFEMGPNLNLGNNFMASNTSHAVGWFDSGGQTPNVVKVDGPGDNAPCQNYGNNGPENDASGLATCTNPRHYLDITNGRNSVYQRFTPRCSGTVTFGASFSTRGNSGGLGNIRIRQGNSITSPVISTTNVNLPGGNSKTDPWRKTTGSIALVAGQTYVFEVFMNNNLNMDDAFVYFPNCDTVPLLPDVANPDWTTSGQNGGGGGGGGFGGPILDGTSTGDQVGQADISMEVPKDPIQGKSPCCAPWSEQDIPSALQPIFPTNAGSPYTMQYLDPATLNTQMAAYLDYVHAMDPSITTITMQWTALNLGTGTTPNNSGAVTGGMKSVTWTWTPSGVTTSVSGGGFWSGTPFQVNSWYGFVTRLSHNGTRNSPYFGRDCLNNTWKFRWSTQGMRQVGTGGAGEFQTLDARGRVIRSGPVPVAPGKALRLPGAVGEASMPATRAPTRSTVTLPPIKRN